MGGHARIVGAHGNDVVPASGEGRAHVEDGADGAAVAEAEPLDEVNDLHADL